MPKKPIDYSKALIYSIVCKADPNLLYIGSTTDFRHRKSVHKSRTKNDNTQVYVMVRANGGWDAFEMKPVKEFPCENKIQLVIEEERIRKEMNANLNSQRSFTSVEMRKQDVFEKNKVYYHTNKEEILIKQKDYTDANKDKITEYKKEYRKTNRDEILTKQKEWREANKDKIAEQNKAYVEANRDKVKERKRKWYLAKKEKT
jgi:predicted GIY-YIG superfamily endonuclease